MITPFGKELRKIRLDRNLLLKDMAEELGFTSSYLSAIENGKKKIPDDFTMILQRLFNLNDVEIDKLEIAELESSSSIEFNLEKLDLSQKDFIFSFARRFDEIPQETLEEFKRMIDKIDGKGGVNEF
jgi:transcriptional regulator with XRE-family HTH domain